ncbi:MAG: hypothetical protein ABL984_08925 [Pyrinomonadaceae bacterium]
MEIMRAARPERTQADVKLWICGGCDVVHMSVGKTVLSFDRREFSDFANAVTDLSSAEWTSRGPAFSILDLVATQSEAIH